MTILQALVIPFAVVVLDVLRDGRSEVPLAERNQPVQAFFFDGPHKPFGVGVRIRLIVVAFLQDSYVRQARKS